MATHTFSGNVLDRVGGSLVSPNGMRARAWMVPANQVVAEDGESRVGPIEVTIANDGSFSVADLPEDGYRFELRYYAAGAENAGATTWRTPWFSLDDDLTLEDVVADNATPYVPTGGTKGDLAQLQGYWLVVSEDPPAEDTMYGVPVVWIDPGDPLTPTPVNPAVPVWDDGTSKLTVPTTTGVRYVWTSGGGKTPGAILTPGAEITTSGTYPRTVVITPEAKPGYVLFNPSLYFSHDFPDPAALTTLTSDGYSGSAADLFGRTTDLYDGGTAKTYGGVSGAFETDGDGNAVRTSGTGSKTLTLSTTSHNLRIEFDLVSLTNASSNTVGATFTIRRASGLLIGVGMGDDRTRIDSNNNGGGGVNLQLGLLTPPPTGRWTIQLFQRTATVTPPGGPAQVYDLSDTSTYKAETGLELATVEINRGGDTSDTFVFTDLKVIQVGF